MQDAGRTIDDRYVADIAARADVDARTVVRRLAGLPVKGRAGKRVDAALAEIPPHAPEARATQ